MTRDEIQKLIGGYATGSLTEAERKLLFEAALEDQELFDELGREQALKELLDEPGARQRLVAALGPEEMQAKRTWWPWVTAAAFALAGVMALVVLRPGPKPEPQQIAMVRKVAPQEAPQVVPPVTPEAVPQAAPRAKIPVPRAGVDKPVQVPLQTPVQVSAQAQERQAVALVPPPEPATAPVATPPPPPTPVVPAQADLLKQESAKTVAVDQSDNLPVLSIGGNGTGLRNPTQVVSLIPAPPVPAAPAAVGGAGGGRGGGRGGATRAVNAFAANPSFGFDYSMTLDGALRIVPASAGYLSVTTTQPTVNVLFPAGIVTPGNPITVRIPADASDLLVGFSAQPGGTTGSPVKRDQTSGTVQDPNGRILVTIPAK